MAHMNKGRGFRKSGKRHHIRRVKKKGTQGMPQKILGILPSTNCGRANSHVATVEVLLQAKQLTISKNEALAANCNR